MQLIIEEEVCVPTSYTAKCVKAGWTSRVCKHGTHGCIGHEEDKAPERLPERSPQLIAYSILQDYLIDEAECNSVDFDAIYGRYTMTELLLEIEDRIHRQYVQRYKAARL